MSKAKLEVTTVTVSGGGLPDTKMTIAYPAFYEGVVYCSVSTYRYAQEWDALGIPTSRASVIVNPDDAPGVDQSKFSAFWSFGASRIVWSWQLAGRRLTYSNGNYIEYGELENDGTMEAEYYLADGTRLLYTSDVVGKTFPVYFQTSSAGTKQEIIGGFDWTLTRDGHGGWYGRVASSGTYIPTSSMVKAARFLIDVENVTDPYEPGGTSDTDGGNGSFDNTSTPVDFPDLPTISAKDAGFITLFNPTGGELQSLARYMWTNSAFDVDTWKKIFADPMDAILGLSIIPCTVASGGTRTVSVGNISTGISMNIAGVQYTEIDCGSISVNEYWGSYLDYSPYTEISIYLPYIGIRPLNVDDVMGKTLAVKYHIDILSGSCCAYIKCSDTVLYSYVGNCATSVPITGNDWTNAINGALTVASSIGTAVLTGGATAPAAAGTVAANIVNNIKPTVERSGSMSGSGGLMGVQTPYLILTRPRQALPAGQNAFTGYPVYISSLLSDVSGYTEIDKIHLENVPATGDEISEIETLLKSGVIL